MQSNLTGTEYVVASITIPEEEENNGPCQPEIILLVGCPGLGKTTFYRRHLSEYVHVNQDTLKRREKCLAALEDSLKAGKSCVIGSLGH